MQKQLRNWLGATAVAAFVIGISSCAYDPYYSSSSVSGSYSTGYSSGYDGSAVSTSLFISTGDARWGYDPNTYCYYDYNRRAYYDPYLYGYYPVGYRPRVVYGTPHPYGWRPGHGHIRPPSRIYNTNIRNYQNREYAYRNSNYTWAKNVRQQPGTSRPYGNSYDRSGGPNSFSRPNYSGNSNQRPASNYRTEQQRPVGSNRYTPPTRQPQGNSRLPSNYNTPVTSPGRVPNAPTRYTPPSRTEQPRYSAPERTQQPRYSTPERAQQPRYSAPDRSMPQRVAPPDRSSQPRYSAPDRSSPQRAVAPERSAPQRTAAPDGSSRRERRPGESGVRGYR